MVHLIDKDALVAEINKRITDAPISYIGHQRVWAYNDVKDILDTLEVKEVDLEKELSKYNRQYVDDNGFFDTMHLAKHFFELGINASNPLTWEDMMIIHKCCKDAMNHNLYAWETAEGQQKIYEEVLKRFKDFKERKEK